MGSVYGLWPACYVALTCLCGYRITADGRLLDWALAVGKGYTSTAFPADVAVPALDAGLGIGLLADLYEITGDRDWLTDAESLASKVAELYCDCVIPRGAAGIDWYESQMGPSFLLHGIARVGLMARDGLPCLLDADYTAR